MLEFAKTAQAKVPALRRPNLASGQRVHAPRASHDCRGKLRGALPVDLSVLRWYQKRAGLVGVLPNLGRGLHFSAYRFTSQG